MVPGPRAFQQGAPEELTKLAPLRLANAEAIDPIADERLRGHRTSQINAVCFFGALLLTALGFAFLRERAKAEPPRKPARDSQDFLAALTHYSDRLEPNPRGAIRFANLARLLYYLIVGDRLRRAPTTEPSEVSLDEHFCDLLTAYWTHRPPSHANAPRWLVDELHAWLGATLRSEPAISPHAAE